MVLCTGAAMCHCKQIRHWHAHTGMRSTGLGLTKSGEEQRELDCLQIFSVAPEWLGMVLGTKTVSVKYKTTTLPLCNETKDDVKTNLRLELLQLSLRYSIGLCNNWNDVDFGV